MAMEDIIAIHRMCSSNSYSSAKKMKLQQEEFPKPQDATDKIKLEEEKILKSEDETNTVNFGSPRLEGLYIVILELKDIRQQRATGGDSMSLFRRVMKDAGCCESQIIEESYSSYCFEATLTPEEAKKLSDLNSVRQVKPEKMVYLAFDHKIPCVY